MTLHQQIKVLPAGADFTIIDDDMPVIDGCISKIDKSIFFPIATDAERYFGIYQTFHVKQISVNISGGCITYMINVR
ncbi:MAG: hypothetical protein IKF11_10790 [Methanobrevibacter sp.]|nr:hypothetical protein [Methanobrevibacter sp.]